MLYISRSLLPPTWFSDFPCFADISLRDIVLNPEAYPPGVSEGTPLRLAYVADHDVAGTTQREIVLAVDKRRAVIAYVGNVGTRGSIQVVAEVEGMAWSWRKLAFDHEFAGQRPATRVWWQSAITV